MVNARVSAREVLNCVEVVAPSVVYRTPPSPPPTQKLVPFVLATLRGLLPDAKSMSAVVASRVPFNESRPTMRGTVADEVVERFVGEFGASYPVKTRYLPS